ncbi:MAG: phosphoglycerate dehydrogenase [Deltaproteobacteria bacterium]|nr:phosphoglycerate dehydrogenase [Deltaproteobacteria bacterium]
MDTFKVLVADDLSTRGVEILRSSKKIDVDVKVGLKPAELLQIIRNYDALVVRSATKVTAEVLEAGTRLKIVGRAGIGVDNIDVKAASRRGVIVENTPSGNAVTTAEHALSLLLSLARKIPQATASMKAGKWEKKKFQGVELLDKEMGVIGLGNIGRIVADRACGLKMKVIAYDPFISKEAAASLGAELVTLDELLSRADFISVHTPLTPDTRGLINEAAFAKMKPGVLVINAARGEIVDEAALVKALESGKLGGAALDVFAKEPPDPSSPTVLHEKVICTPHLGASTDEAQEKVAIEVAEQIVAFVDRGEVKNAVNIAPVRPEVLPRLQPWMDLAAKLGSLIGQVHPREGGIEELEVEVIGEVADYGVSPVGRAALAGLLRTFLDVPVNEVNAPIIAGERGLRVVEVKRHQGVNFSAAVGLRTRGASATRYVQGTIFRVGDQHEPRIVQIDDFVLDAAPEGRILFIQNADRPGVIGHVGTVLGQKGINVARLHVGLDKTKGTSVQLWNVDAELPSALLEEIRRQPNIVSAQQVTL